MAKPKVLITGASGLIGRLTIAGLGDKYEFSALNRRPVSGIPCLQADIKDAEAIKPAFRGMDMVLHLSAFTEGVDEARRRVNRDRHPHVRLRTPRPRRWLRSVHRCGRAGSASHRCWPGLVSCRCGPVGGLGNAGPTPTNRTTQ